MRTTKDMLDARVRMLEGELRVATNRREGSETRLAEAEQKVKVLIASRNKLAESICALVAMLVEAKRGT